MAYRDRIHACNGWDPAAFVPFRIGPAVRGRVRHGVARRLADWPQVFRLSQAGLDLHPALQGREPRSAAVAGVMQALHASGELPYLAGESFPVGPDRDHPELLLNRAAVPWLGVRGYGQHLNGYVRDGDRLWMWIGKRSASKRNFPGLLDHLVAGGLPHGIGLADNLAKECREEAGMSAELAARARPVGALSYCRDSRWGLKPDIVYCYDLELPADFQPRCTDGEVDSFRLLPLQEVQALVRDSTAFKPNCSLVIIDFLIRHGYLGPEDPDYLELVQGLHPPLP
jgi:8-oxo-dGTP pyrophosphatase MutT (NUDIX family)